MLERRILAIILVGALIASVGVALGSGFVGQTALPPSDPKGIILAPDGSEADCSQLSAEDRLLLSLFRAQHEADPPVGTEVTYEEAISLLGHQPARPTYLPASFAYDRTSVSMTSFVTDYSDGPIERRTLSPDEPGHPRLRYYQTPIGDTFSEAWLKEYVAGHPRMQLLEVDGAVGYGYAPRIQELSQTCGIYHAGRVVWYSGDTEFGVLGYFPLDTLLAIARSVA